MESPIQAADLQVTSLGECRFDSPLHLSRVRGDGLGDFVSDRQRILYEIEFTDGKAPSVELCFEKAGPREKLFFDPPKTTVGIVNCGGLCPGMNNVIRSAYYELRHNYQVEGVLGFRQGYRGLNAAEGMEPLKLTDSYVEEIQKLGGTVLGTSRGAQPPEVVVDRLREHNIDVLICVGGDGTQRGAHAIAEECGRRGLEISVVGIPKTIDNDVALVDRSFGYLTSLEEAQGVLRCAHVEACCAVNGVAVVKLMGRHAGFIAAGAALASQEANFVLVPEVQFPLEGENGFLPALEQRIRRRGHAVVVVAEGAGQDLLPAEGKERDASGNVKPAEIGSFLCDRIKAYFERADLPISMKYFDPSYTIRSVPAKTADRLMCDQYARHAVHAGMAGKTDLLIGFQHSKFVHIPLPAVNARKKRLDVEGDRWTSVLLTTGQPRWGYQRHDG